MKNNFKKVTVSDDKSREKIANPHLGISYHDRLAKAGAIDLRNNSKTIALGNGYMTTIPIDPNKRWGY